MAFFLPRAETESQYCVSEPDMNRSPHESVFPLCQLPAGKRARVRELTGDADFCQRVREMGFGESAYVTKVGGSGPFICQVNGTRIALSHGAAMGILVEQLSARR
jgi:ferrous iron transport protein A